MAALLSIKMNDVFANLLGSKEFVGAFGPILIDAVWLNWAYSSYFQAQVRLIF